MIINLIILAVTILMGGFVAVWLCCPWLRGWMEAPKYRILKWETPSATSRLENFGHGMRDNGGTTGNQTHQ